MTTPIFGLRFKSNEALQPSALDLSAFLGQPRAAGARERHGDDLAPYVAYLELIETYEAGRQQGLAGLEFSERMFLGVLSHCRFFNPSLRIAVEEYKYHLARLQALDFNKPAAFIRSAEKELGTLNPKKKEDQQKIARFQDMIAQRKRDQEGLDRQRRALAGELYHIAVYVLENLVLIRQLCETTIGKLAELQVGGEKTNELIEDVKSHFKDQVRENLQAGPVTKDYIESLKTEVAELTKALSKQMLEDLYAVTRIYETLYEHVRESAEGLQKLADQAKAVRSKSAGGWEVFGRIERALVALIVRFRVESRQPRSGEAGSGHAALLMEKRKEMLEHIFELLRDPQAPWRH